jgi:hypothetical protein
VRIVAVGPVPGLLEALNPREDETHGGTEEVPRGASGAGGPLWRSMPGVTRRPGPTAAADR